MTVELYDSEIREINRFEAFDGTKYIIINQSYWYDISKFTEEQAIADFCKQRGIRKGDRYV